MLNKHRIIHTKTFLHTLRDDANLLFKGCCSVLVKRWQIRFLVCGAESNGLCVALDGVLILASLEILVALVLCCLGPIQRALNETEREGNIYRFNCLLCGSVVVDQELKPKGGVAVKPLSVIINTDLSLYWSVYSFQWQIILWLGRAKLEEVKLAKVWSLSQRLRGETNYTA